MALGRWNLGTLPGWAEHANGRRVQIERDGRVAIGTLLLNEASLQDAYPEWLVTLPDGRITPLLFTDRWRYLEDWSFEQFLAEQRGLAPESALALLARVRCAPDPR